VAESVLEFSTLGTMPTRPDRDDVPGQPYWARASRWEIIVLPEKVFLASDAAPFVMGQIVTVEGGRDRGAGSGPRTRPGIHSHRTRTELEPPIARAVSST
jgi:hypothetical protein